MEILPRPGYEPVQRARPQVRPPRMFQRIGWQPACITPEWTRAPFWSTLPLPDGWELPVWNSAVSDLCRAIHHLPLARWVELPLDWERRPGRLTPSSEKMADSRNYVFRSGFPYYSVQELLRLTYHWLRRYECLTFERAFQQVLDAPLDLVQAELVLLRIEACD